MKAIQDAPGSYYYTDDAAELRFSEAEGPAPDFVTAFVVGRSGGFETAATATVALKDCALMAQGLFGEPRGTRTRWTGASHRFGIYSVVGRLDPRVLIFQTHGAGASFYLLDEFDAYDTWTAIVAQSPPELLWNICRSLVDTYDKGRKDGQREMQRTMLQQRSRRRERRAMAAQALRAGSGKWNPAVDADANDQERATNAPPFERSER